MNAINRFKRDHDLLRTRLNILESALAAGQDAWLVLREVSFTLSNQLGEHIKHEEALFARCRPLTRPMPGRRGMFDHDSARECLVTIKRFFAEQSVMSLDPVRPAFFTLITELRQGIRWQEERLFPRVENILVLQELLRRHPRRSPPRLVETMTVEQVVSQYPAAAEVLVRLFITDPFERYDCLDEVAWRHGMDSQALVTLLEHAIACDGEVNREGGEDVVRAALSNGYHKNGRSGER